MMVYPIRKAVPKLKFNKEYLQRLTKPLPKKEPGMKEATTAEVQAQPRHPTGFLQYCMNCGKTRPSELTRSDGRRARFATARHPTEARDRYDTALLGYSSE